MSVSTTQVVPAAVHDLLKAYDLHHSGTESSQSPQVEGALRASRQPANPPSWPSDRRRVPAYREPSRDHRLADRPAGQNTTEAVMVTVTFIGVYVLSGVSKLWHQTGGRINDRIFRYEVGGER